MKALRYLLMMLAVTGVLSVSAQTPKYGKPYKPYGRSDREVSQREAQMPSAEMRSTGSVIMASGSTLPQAALTGTTMADESEAVTDGAPKRPIRRDPGVIEFPDDDDEQPVGDAALPLALFALIYVSMRVFFKKYAKKG